MGGRSLTLTGLQVETMTETYRVAPSPDKPLLVTILAGLLCTAPTRPVGDWGAGDEPVAAEQATNCFRQNTAAQFNCNTCHVESRLLLFSSIPSLLSGSAQQPSCPVH